MARLWAQSVDFDAISVGDSLPVVIKWETEDSIRRYVERHGGDGDVLPREALVRYVVELLGKGFPPERVEAADGGLEVEQAGAVCAGDTISLSGWVTGVEEAAGRRLVRCAVLVENDRGEAVARACAVISL